MRERLVRRAGGALRRRRRTDRRGLYEAGQRRLSARGRLVRMLLRGQAGHRPDVRTRRRRGLRQDLQHRRIRCLSDRPARHRRSVAGSDGRGVARSAGRFVRSPSDGRL